VQISTTTKPSIYLYGYYGVSNVGDDLLMKSVLDFINNKVEIEDYYVRCAGDGAVVSPNCSSAVIRCEDYTGGSVGMLKKTVALFRFIFKNYAILKKVNAFVLGGGTVISNYRSNTSLILLSILVTLARLHGVKVFGLGLGVANLESRFSRAVARYIINNMVTFCARDVESFSVCKQITPKANVLHTADLVYTERNLIALSVKKHNNGPGFKTAGITLVEPFLISSKHQFVRTTVLTAFSNFIEQWVASGNKVKLLCFQNHVLAGGQKLSDSNLFEELNNICTPLKLEIVDMNSDIDSIGRCYSELDIVIGMRFHSLVLASMSKTPFVGLSCDKKISTLCDTYKMPCTTLEAVTDDWIESSIKRAIEIGVTQSITDKLILKSIKNFDDVITYLKAEDN
jgi:polysaccharide pyruvyl transferase WcaK-like protein